VIIARRAFTTALSLTGLAALAGVSSLRLIGDALAQSAAAADVAKPVSLPDMAIGPANASVTITEFASMTCPHCAEFNEKVFPKIKSEYIDTGKVRYVFREFPLDDIALAASTMTRCVARDDAPKYFALVDILFKMQKDLVGAPLAAINRVGKQAGFSEQAIKACVDEDPSTRQKIIADQKYANEVLKVEGTPTFFINGEVVRGAPLFELFDKKIRSLLKS
jgi:protein-disulfide isomerase